MQDERFKRECEAVQKLGDEIGFGNMMDIASAVWAYELIQEEISDEAAFYPTILSNMKPGDLTVSEMNRRTILLNMFKKWGW